MDHRPVPTAPGAAGPVAPAGAGDIAGQLKEELKALLLDTKLNLLLVLIPFAFISYYAHWCAGMRGPPCPSPPLQSEGFLDAT